MDKQSDFNSRGLMFQAKWTKFGSAVVDSWWLLYTW